MKLKIPKPISGGLILSYRCSAECRHCMYACSPRWRDDWILKDDLVQILEQLAGAIEPGPYGPDHMSLNHGLHFTGGEPFLNFDLLCQAVEIAGEFKIPSMFVETNCFWAVNDDVAREKLGILKRKGLTGILISVNPFYLEYVPFERTERAIRASQEVFGQNTMVYQMEYFRSFKRLGIKSKMSFEEFLTIERGEDFARNVEFFMSGRAPYRINLPQVFHCRTVEYFFDEPCRPAFLRNWHNHFDNFGNFMPGYCGGISLGDCRHLDNLLEKGIDEAEYPVLAFLINGDMQGLAAFAKERGYPENEQGYLSKCHLCVDIRKHLSDIGGYKELAPKEFYMHQFQNE